MYEINNIAETDTQLEITRKGTLKFIQFFRSLVSIKNYSFQLTNPVDSY